jgi:hypothetical protein
VTWVKWKLVLVHLEVVLTNTQDRCSVCANTWLTIGNKTLATAFFVADVQGSYNLILGRDWIHANCCVSSSLHQFLIQWVGDAVEIVHSDSSIDVGIADAPVLRGA